MNEYIDYWVVKERILLILIFIYTSSMLVNARRCRAFGGIPQRAVDVCPSGGSVKGRLSTTWLLENLDVERCPIFNGL